MELSRAPLLRSYACLLCVSNDNETFLEGKMAKHTFVLHFAADLSSLGRSDMFIDVDSLILSSLR